MYGFSNLKIFFILAFASFILGWLILFLVNPVTSSFIKYYEKTKSSYARDIDHLVTFNKNGLWIKETVGNTERIVTASKFDTNIISNVEIFELDQRFNLKRKIISKKISIETNDWILDDAKFYTFKDGVLTESFKDKFIINSQYNYEKLINLFNNADTLAFIEIITNFKKWYRIQ